eukprot:TRINITY_DN1451_c0_g1_i2.p1 TRINITY_DN1451_c0_g1~~TRINITY_DN1451_c0_g1_i2.p1  ORF type:complete len:1062 (-),score=261.65 TRINITY_DN1451_c0_g1_i2:615-3377(-)
MPSSLPDTGPVANHTRYHVSTNHSADFYSSCEEVKFSATGTTVFELFGWDRGYEAWFSYMGDPNEYSPYLITFNFTSDDDDLGFHDPVIPCNSLQYPCACADCTPSCASSSPAYIVKKAAECNLDWAGTSVSCYVSAVIISFIFFMLIVPPYLAWLLWKSGDSAVSQSEDAALTGTQKPDTGEAVVMRTKRKASLFQKKFYLIAQYCASHPLTVLTVGLLCSAACGMGIFEIQIETDPVDLWVSGDATTKQNMDKFDNLFDPFYRIEQIIITDVDPTKNVITRFHLDETLKLQDRIKALVARHNGNNFTLDEVCNKPVRGYGCIVNSPLSWWQNSREAFDATPTDEDVRAKVAKCSIEQAVTDCRSDIDAPTDPNVVLGGFSDREYLNATAIVVTYLLNNRPEDRNKNEKWEDEFLDEVGKGIEGLTVLYSSEKSVEAELNRDALSDIGTVVISYIVMLVYVALALGRPMPSQLFVVRSRFMLSFAGVILVLFSMVIATGIWSYLGVRATLIISQVIPFLILSIGMDNMFIIVNTFDRTDVNLPIPQRLGQTLASVGVSMTAASISETFAFLLGALTEMPAVQAFTLYAALSIAVGYILQITCFISLVALDAQREQGKRIDCLPCIPLTRKFSVDVDALCLAELEKEPITRKLIRVNYVPLLFQPVVRMLTIVSFVAVTMLSLSTLSDLPLGLNQKVAVPSDSYLQPYFDAIEQLLMVGAPTYFVVQNVNYSTPAGQNKICTLTGCNDDSLGNVVNGAKDVPDDSLIALSLSNWVDDYIGWIRLGECCRYFPNNDSYCPPNDQCDGGIGLGCRNCRACLTDEDFDNDYRPSPESFKRFLPWFLESQCSDDCGVCGTAYQSNVILDENTDVVASRYMTYHRTLRTQQDFIDALSSANDMADQVKKIARCEHLPVQHLLCVL